MTSSVKQGQEYIHLEEFDKERDLEFIRQVVIPYFSEVFQDLERREEDQQKGYISKATFLEYSNLPGIVGDRFYSMMDPKDTGAIEMREFVHKIIMTFISDLDTKLRMTFRMYDFNNDGQITKEDVRMVMSYIPFLPDRTEKPDREGNYLPEEGRGTDFQQRLLEQKELTKFVEAVFEGKEYLNLEEYKAINTERSSEMLFSLLSLLHDRLPCSSSFFRFKTNFRKWQEYNNESGSPLGNRSNYSKIASPNILANFDSCSFGGMSQELLNPNAIKSN
jgi:Ca2+-binding EF-hand superfamily protein